MPINRLLRVILPSGLLDDITDADNGNYGPLVGRLRDAVRQDAWMKKAQPNEEGTKYYKPFVRTVVPKILRSIREALAAGRCPEIEITADEIKATRKRLGISEAESPQDVLYAFCSERYANWGTALRAMGFASACMSGQAKATITMAPRLLEVSDQPDIEVEEIEGAIPRDFRESIEMVFKDAPFLKTIKDLYHSAGMPHPLNGVINEIKMSDQDPPLPAAAVLRQTEVANFQSTMGTLLADLAVFSRSLPSGLDKAMARINIEKINDEVMVAKLTHDRYRYARLVKLIKSAGSIGEELNAGQLNAKLESAQEQIALKYVEEGRFLQKILAGARVDHIQSNVKMQTNALRGFKCEVDSIYRVLGKKEIVLVEAKGKKSIPQISRTQLYQIYETFRFRMPKDWNIRVVAVLGSDPDEGEVDEFSKVIDLIEVKFNRNAIGKMTESIAGIRPVKNRHYRWKIKRQQPSH